MLPIAILRMKSGGGGGGGGGGLVLADADYTVVDSGGSASVTLNINGTVTLADTAGGSVAGTPWITTAPQAGASGFEVFSHKDSGTALGITQPTADAWLPMSSPYTWAAATNGVATRNGVFSVQIREIATPANIVTIVIDVTSAP